jgi:cobalt ABC transporter, permease protein CbiQ
MIIIDKLAYSSKLRYKSPMLKSLFAVGTLLICVTAHLLVLSVFILAVMAYITIVFSRVSVQRYLKLMGIPLGFLLMSTITIMINLSDKPADLFSLAVAGKYLIVSSSSLTEGIRLVMIALASVSCLYFLTLTTPMVDIFIVLRRLRCPRIIVELMMLIYRYIFVVLDMASAIRTSQNCRLGNRDFPTELRSFGQMATVLLVRSMSRSSYLFDAMESRCYNGEILVLEESRPAKSNETVAVVGFLILLSGCAVLLKLGGVL